MRSAAVEVLRARRLPGARFRARPLCCGRPLYEFGMLDTAQSYLKRVLQALDADMRAGTPIVVLEPACLSVFSDELPKLLPR